MFGFFCTDSNCPPKANRGFKLTTTERTRKIGVAASSLKILKKKATEKLKVDEVEDSLTSEQTITPLSFQVPKCRIYLSADGTEVQDEDYFATIPDQSVLVVAGEKEAVKTDFQLIIECFRTRNASLLAAAQGTTEFVENNREKIKQLLEGILSENQRADKNHERFSLKTEHPDWFQGTDSKYNTKEEVMVRRAQDRIRGYFYKAKDELTKTELYRGSQQGRRELDNLLRLFRMLLHGCDHFGILFDRSRAAARDEFDSGEPLSKRTKEAVANEFLSSNPVEESCRALCNTSGLFNWQGKWDENQCPQHSRHSINPYQSRESLIVFQTWNLDHQIEFGRTVIPGILSDLRQLIEEPPKCPVHKLPVKSLNGLQLFRELFTMANLKLVHIACHVKEAHSKASAAGLLCGKCADYKTVEEFFNKIHNRD